MEVGDTGRVPVKIEEIGQDGTVFVRVRTGRGLWLDKGDVFMDGDPKLADDPKPKAPKDAKAKLAAETK